MQIHGMYEPIESAKTSTGKPKKSLTFESDQDAAKRTQAEQEQKQQAVQSDASKANQVQQESILKTSSDGNTAETTVKLADGSSELSTDYLSDFEAGKEGAVDYGEVASNKVLDQTESNTNRNAQLAPEVTAKIAAEVTKSIEFNKQKKQAEKDASIKLAKELESKARVAKTDTDIQDIIREIDPTGKLTSKIIDEAIQASKIWRDPFDGTTYQRWVEVLSRITSYAWAGKPVPDAFVKQLKALVDENKGDIKSKQDAQAAQAKIEAAKQAKIKEIDAKIAKNDQLIQEKINDSSELVSQIQSKESDIGLHYALNDPFNTRYVFGDSAEVTAVKKEISQLQAKIEQSQKDISAIAQDSNKLQDQKSLFNESGDVDSLSKAESAQVEKTSPVTQPKEHLCDSIEECISKMNDPADQASLSSLFKEIDRLSKDPNFTTKYKDPKQQEAIKYFVDNGENIISSVSFALWNARTIRSQAENLPKSDGAPDLSESSLITKAQVNPARVQAEQQAALQQKSTSPATDLFASTAVAA